MTRQKTVLESVRSALSIPTGREHARARIVDERLAHPPRHPLPACAKVDSEHRDAQLIHSLESQGADVIAITDLGALPAAAADYLGKQSTPPWLFVSNDPRFASLPWNDTPHVSRPRHWTAGEPLGDGDAALSHALAAIAETGTLMLESSAGNPASLAFLPEYHLVVVARETIVAAFEEAFARLRDSVAGDRFPRSVNLISGPSRTGDIGGRIVRGAHGPRRLAVFLYGPTTAPRNPADGTR